jgi:hypothetical protein
MRRNGIRSTLRAWVAAVRAQVAQRRASLVTVGAAGSSALLILAFGVLVVGPSAPTPAHASGPGGSNLSVMPAPGSASVGQPSGAGRLPAISGYGDSVLLDARSSLGQLFNGGSIDAIVGRQPGPILADIRAAAEARALHPVVIIHIGNNGLIRASDFEKTLQLLENPATGAHVVLVLTDHIDPYRNSWQQPNNRLIERVVPRYPNAHIVQWDRAAGKHHNWLYRDDLHLRPTGATGYAQLIAAAYRNAILPAPIS